MGPPKKKPSGKTSNSVQGSQNHRTANLCKVDPCPIPDYCKGKDPQEYKNWGQHRLTVKKHGELKEVVEELTDIEDCLLGFTSEKLTKKYLEDKFPSLSSFEVTEFQLQFSGAKAKKIRSEKQRTLQQQNIVSWRYTTWEYKNKLSLTIAEERTEYEKYQREEEYTDLWTGNGSQKEFKFMALPSKQDADVKDDQIKMEVSVGENEMQRGTDYTVDRQNCSIKFKTAPSEIIGIRARYSFPKKGPADPKRGASLEVARESCLEDIGHVDMGKFGLSADDIVESTVHVTVEDKPKERGVDYELDLYYDNQNKIKWCIVFKNNSIPKASETIKVTYAEYSNRNTDVYVKIQKDDFEIVQRDALDHLEYFLEIVRNANTEKYEEDFENKMNLEEVKKWVKEWNVPYPSRLLKERKDLDKVEFMVKCEEPNCRRKGIEVPVTQSMTVKGKVAPQCFECGKVTKIVYGKTGVHGDKYETKSKVAVLAIDKYYSSTLRKEIVKTCDIESLPVFFQVDKPKPGSKDSETEDKILNINKTPNLEGVAGLLVRQLRKIKNEGETGKTQGLLRFWGYADRSAGCKYNEKLSVRRVEWVEQKIKNILETKYDFQIVGDVLKMRDFKMVGYKVIRDYVECAKIMGRFGCGRGLADKRKKDNPQYSDDGNRAVIIELDIAA